LVALVKTHLFDDVGATGSSPQLGFWDCSAIYLIKRTSCA